MQNYVYSFLDTSPGLHESRRNGFWGTNRDELLSVKSRGDLVEFHSSTKCGELVFNYAADEQILDAVKAQAAVLSAS
jgi:hypothetical protein